MLSKLLADHTALQQALGFKFRTPGICGPIRPKNSRCWAPWRLSVSSPANSDRPIS